MSTNSDVISDALRLIGVISEIDTPSAELGAVGLRRLNQLMDAWTEDGIDLDYTEQSSLTDDCPIPTWAERAVTHALALDMAALYPSQSGVSAELLMAADQSYSTVLRRTLNASLEGADNSHLPMGSGHYGAGWDINSDEF